MKKILLSDAWRMMGFGFDGRADKLRTLKHMVPQDQVITWFNVNTAFGYEFSDDDCKNFRAISKKVSDELLFRANERRICVYSDSPARTVPTAFRKSWLSLQTSFGEVFIGNDLLLDYRATDVIDAILDVCQEMHMQRHPAMTKYLSRAADVLSCNKSIFGTGPLPGFMNWIKQTHFNTETSRHLISEALPLQTQPDLAKIMYSARP